MWRQSSDAVSYDVDEFFDSHPRLHHRVALADRDGVVVERVEVDGDRERRADLVLPAIAAPNRLRLVVLGHEVWLQAMQHIAGERRQLLVLRQRQHRDLVWREARM